MRMKHLVLATVAALATVLPARADLTLVFRQVGVPPTTLSTALRTDYKNTSGGLTGTQGLPGTSITGTTLNIGETKYFVAFMQLDATSNVGPNEAFWAANQGTFRLRGFGMNMNFNPGLVTNPYIPYAPTPTLDENVSNLQGQAGFGLQYPNQPYPNNYRQILGIGINGTSYDAYDIDPNLGVGPGALFAFKVTGVADTGGSPTPIVFSKYTNGPSGTPVDNFEVSNNVPGASVYLDNELFSAAHQTFSFNVTVTGVPEPSSMALAGIAFAGFGWRKLRRKKA